MITYNQLTNIYDSTYFTECIRSQAFPDTTPDGFVIPECNLPWELSLLKFGEYLPCTTAEQYQSKTINIAALVEKFSDKFSKLYKYCPGENCIM